MRFDFLRYGLPERLDAADPSAPLDCRPEDAAPGELGL
jgi:hypothetical protein